MASGGRYGGHFVQVHLGHRHIAQNAHMAPQGHVDTTATVVSATPDGNSIRLLFRLPDGADADEYLAALVTKGYVALDGTSLTLTSVDDAARTFGVMLIAHTQERVVLTAKKPGDRVNVEVDIVGKGVAKIVKRSLEGDGSLLQAYVDKAVERALAKRNA
jgi:riboflavin synthase